MITENKQEPIQPKPLAVLAPPAQSHGVSIFETADRFEHFQRVAKAFASSNLVPESFQGNIPNALIALDMADRLRANPLAVMQSIYIVHGKPSWSSTFIIGMINSCGKFRPLKFDIQGDGDNRSCIAWTIETATGDKVEGPPVTIAMAKAEGWYGKNGSKWKTMPELMLRYRAATFFGRLYCPELLMGMKVEEEVLDVMGPPRPGLAKPWKATHGPILAEIIDDPEPPSASEPEAKAEADAGLAPVEKPKAAKEPAPAGQLSPQDELRNLVEQAGFNIDDFKVLATNEDFFKDADSIGSWDEVPLAVTKRIMRNRLGILQGLEQLKGGQS